MASTSKETTICCQSGASSTDLVAKASSSSSSPSLRREAASAEVSLDAEWDVNQDLGEEKKKRNSEARIPSAVLSSMDAIAEASKAAGPVMQMLRAHPRHPLDPLSAAEIAVAVATVRAAGTTPEVRDGMRFIEVVLKEPDKHVVALADAYFFSFPAFTTSKNQRWSSDFID